MYEEIMDAVFATALEPYVFGSIAWWTILNLVVGRMVRRIERVR